MNLRAWIQKSWRWLEGLHTAVWLYTLLPAVIVAWIGALSGIGWFWILVGAFNVAAVALYISQYFLCNAGWLNLLDASAIAFDKLQNTYVGTLAAKAHDSPEKRLDFVATHIAMYAPIFGKVQPSRDRTEIDPQEFKMGVFWKGGSAFRYHHAITDAYSELEIRKRDLQRAIRMIRKELKAPGVVEP